MNRRHFAALRPSASQCLEPTGPQTLRNPAGPAAVHRNPRWSRFARLLRFVPFWLVLSCLHANPPEPTIADGSYAPEPGCQFTFWRLPDATKAPLVIYIHGGGFIRGTRNDMANLAGPTMDNGFAVMTIDYPFTQNLPVQAILRLCARAVQYARAQAPAWGIDPHRIICIGGSAGAGASLWIAVHPDLADPSSADPVARESSRISGAGLVDTQLTYNMFRWAELVGYTGPLADMEFFSPVTLYHFKSNDDTPPDTPEARAMLQDVDMHGMIDARTPPLVLRSQYSSDPPVNRGDFIHHPRHAEGIVKRAKEFKVPVDHAPADRNGPNAFLQIVDHFRLHSPAPSPEGSGLGGAR